jgi:hypothetical protein
VDLEHHRDCPWPSPRQARKADARRPSKNAVVLLNGGIGKKTVNSDADLPPIAAGAQK